MLNWSEFENLPGGQEDNFECLCRSLIRIHYEKFGRFAALANQPGVEFHVNIDQDCSIGKKGSWVGWQCRWYDIPKARALGSTRRAKIKESIIKTEKVLPKLTDWILWTRNTLTKDDQKWFYALKTKMNLRLWATEDVERLLVGEAEILRKTYFGELVLTPSSLRTMHEVSVAPIRARWLPAVHQTIEAERTLRRMLGEAESWNELTNLAKRLQSAVSSLKKDRRTLKDRLAPLTSAFIKNALDCATFLKDVHRMLEVGDFNLLQLTLAGGISPISAAVIAAPRCMRAAGLPCGLQATNALADLRLANDLLSSICSFLGTRLIAVIADAGGGKTQLAAQLTSEADHRPAGIFIRGSELHSGRNLHDLARLITVPGYPTPIPSMDALLAALDAAAQRAKRRLPLIIDGLNESENPGDWRPLLSTLDVTLKKFAHVLVICTVRTGARRAEEDLWRYQENEEPSARLDFARQALPDDVERFEIEGFSADAESAIAKYFRHFRINAGDADIPYEFLSHPLSLRMYCEVTNPDRKQEVYIASIANSLAALFQEYVALAIRRIAELSPRNHKYCEHDIRQALDIIGLAFWETSNRELDERELRVMINDDARPWNESVIHLLEQEGVLLLIPGGQMGGRRVIVVYDALGGYLIAHSILTKYGREGFERWIKQPETLEALNPNTNASHPLASDIFRAFVSLVPRRNSRLQLWQLLEGALRKDALVLTTELEPGYFDEGTVNAVFEYLQGATPEAQCLFQRLFRIRASERHPLNANFIDRLLKPMTVGDRDLFWTEWLRRNSERHYAFRSEQLDLPKDIRNLEERWKQNITKRSGSDRLRAKWLIWLLTTTVHKLRDRVTRALYWFGRGDPEALFELAGCVAEINDPYIFERVLAASYGVAMACYSDSSDRELCRKTVGAFARSVYQWMFEPDAAFRTTHILTREYGRRIIELALIHNRRLFSAEEISRTRPPYSKCSRILWNESQGFTRSEIGTESPLGMDFANYTLGQLVEGRANYDFENKGYRKVRSQVLWRIEQLGWNSNIFGTIDQQISNSRYDFGYEWSKHNKVDHYGKKYAWIAYYELAGWLQDEGLCDRTNSAGRSRDVDIDPSFPSRASEEKIITDDLLGNSQTSLAHWLKNGSCPDLKPYIKRDSIRNGEGPWVALDGFVAQQDESRGRRLFAFVRSFLVSKTEATQIIAALNKQSLGGRWLPEIPQSDFTFAGEIPWSSTFRNTGWTDLNFVKSERVVKVKRDRNQPFLGNKPIEIADVIFGLLPNIQDGENKETSSQYTDIRDQVIWRNVTEECEEVEREYRSFRTLIPVYELGMPGEGIEHSSISGISLAKRVANTEHLVALPQTYDLQTKAGQRATFGTIFRPDDYNNHERFFFIRENILRSFLKRENMSLIWAIWGERQPSVKQMNRVRPDGDLAGLAFCNFQEIVRFR